MPESAFIVRIPEAERFVANLRAQYDPSAKLGVPAHITVLPRFMSPELVTDAVLTRVRPAIASVKVFSFALADVLRLPETICLAPQPVEPFLELTGALVHAFPEYPPYAGEQRRIVPHLTVARAERERQGAIAAELQSSLPPTGGITATCSEVVLVENSTGRWELMHAFCLGT
jgi:2'-5' RNA ligase